MKKTLNRSVFYFLLLLKLTSFPLDAAANGRTMNLLSSIQLTDQLTRNGSELYFATDRGTLGIRLYYIQCPITAIEDQSDSLLYKIQLDYWGLKNLDTLLKYGQIAADFVRKILQPHCDVMTYFDSCQQENNNQLYLGFVRTPQGNDLSATLVANGLALIEPLNCNSASSSTHLEQISRLQDIEITAILNKKGLWAHADISQFVKKRTAMRTSFAKLLNLHKKNANSTSITRSLKDINSVSSKELQVVKGVGPATAAKIIAGRPYQTMDDLLKVKGIGPKKLVNIRLHFTVTQTE